MVWDLLDQNFYWEKKMNKKVIRGFTVKRQLQILKEKKLCRSCGKPKDEHVDKWGRHQPCVEQIIETTIANEYLFEDE